MRPRLRLPLLAVLALCALLLVACGGGSSSSNATGSAGTPSTTAPSTSAAAAGHGCRRVPAPAPKGPQNLPKPGKAQALAQGKTYTATVRTSCGSFTITLAAQKAPKTAASFAYLVRKGFYDGLTFHRIVPGFVIQGGDPLGDGTGGPGYQVVEAPPKSTRYTRGVVAMAKTAADPAGASGSQFFVVTGEDAQLPPEYALLGRVTSGQDVVDRIGVLPTDAQQRPTTPVVIEKITVQGKR